MRKGESAKVFDEVEMVDISQKPSVPRVAEAVGEISLRPETVEAIREERVEKGSVLAVAEVAGILAVKRASEIIPLCHPIPISRVKISFRLSDGGVASRCLVSAIYKTGLEMEALVGVTASLLTVWDMVKYLEKDEGGQYPRTRIGDVRVVEKWKGDP